MSLFEETGGGNEVESARASAGDAPGGETDFYRHEAFARDVKAFLDAGWPDTQGNGQGQVQGNSAATGVSQSGFSPESGFNSGHTQDILNFLDAGEGKSAGGFAQADDTPGTGQSLGTSGLRANALDVVGPQGYFGLFSGQETQGSYSSSEDGLVMNLKSGGSRQRPPVQGGGATQASPEEEQRREAREAWLREKGLETVWPGPGGVSSEKSDARPHPKTGEVKPHKGIDIQNPKGASVRASDSGIVTSTNPYGTGENRVTIRHRDGSESTYLHITPSVKVGDYIPAGRHIGNTDMSGNPSGPHIHYEYREYPGGQPVNPRLHLPKRN